MEMGAAPPAAEPVAPSGRARAEPLWIMARTLPPADPNYSDETDPHGDEFSAAEQAALPDIMSAHPKLGRRIGFDHGKASAGEWVDTWHDERDGAVYSVGMIDTSTLTGCLARRAVLSGLASEVSVAHVTFTDKTTGRRVKVPVETTLTNEGDRRGARIVATWSGDGAPTPTPRGVPESARGDYMLDGASSVPAPAPPPPPPPPAFAFTSSMSDQDAMPADAAAAPPAAAPPTAAATSEHTVPASVHLKHVAAHKELQAKFAEQTSAAKTLYDQNTTLQSAAENATKLQAEVERLNKEIATRPALQRAQPGTPAEGAALAITEFLEQQLERELPASERDTVYALAGMLGTDVAVKLRQANAARTRKEREILNENNQLHRKLREMEAADRSLESTEALLRNSASQPWMQQAGAKRVRDEAPPARAATTTTTTTTAGPVDREGLPQFSGGMAKFAPDMFSRLEEMAFRTEFGGMPNMRDHKVEHLGGATISELAMKDQRDVQRARATIEAMNA